MTPTTFQMPELRDNLDNIIQAGAYGKKTAFCNAQNTGVLDYINNNLMYLWANLVDEPTIDSKISAHNLDTNAHADIREALEHVSGVPLGTVIPFSGNNALPNGFLLCNGASVARTMYPDLFNIIGTTYGSVDSEHFNLPDLRDKFIEGADIGGAYKEAGLPNITGFEDWWSAGRGSGNPTGAFRQRGVSALGHADSGTLNSALLTDFDASRSSSIYGNSTTVQPPALTMRYIIKAFDGQTEDSALIDVTQYANELNGIKANYFPLNGGRLSGDIIFNKNAKGQLIISSGSGWSTGDATVYLENSNSETSGMFQIVAGNTGKFVSLRGTSDGTLTWCDHPVATTNKLSMPSGDSYIDIAVEGTGISFTAPTDGWVALIGHQMAQNGSINASLPNGVFVRYDAINGYATVFYPLAKGCYTSAQIISGVFQMARFIYAQSST